MGNGHTLGQKGGEETVTLSAAQMPDHTHFVYASATDSNQRLPDGTVLAKFPGLYAEPNSSPTDLRAGTVENTGGGQAHNNMQPYLTLGFCIALQGLFPSRN
ncbi:hypothetical protein [Breoghania sp.]|uniref:phage tail protein n=1 Tax=Breoghania sp. TaxID=2065378 RepID=UPI003204A2EC